MFKLLLILPFLLLLTGCGRSLEGEAVEQARAAIDAGNYERGSLMLVMGCDDLHAQSVYLIHMARYQASNDLMQMVYAWLAIEGIDTKEDFIRVEAHRLLTTTLQRATVVATD